MPFSYEFDWSILFRPEYRQMLLTGAGYTLFVAFLSSVISLALGAFLALAKLSNIGPITFSATAISVLIRSIPGVFWLLFFYFVFPELLPRDWAIVIHAWSGYAIAAGVIALSIDNSVYVSDIFRSGVRSISPGEREAARACGFTRWQQCTCCLLPLTLRAVVPPLASRTIHNVKNSSLCMVIAVPEMTWASQQVASQSFHVLEALAVATIFYLLLGLLLGRLARWLELRWTKSLRGAELVWKREGSSIVNGASI